MASSSSSDGHGRRVEPVRAATSTGINTLPQDALYDILLRLQAKELCRLRLVCRPWRSLLSDPSFAAAHAARYPEPLILVGYNDSPSPHARDDDWTKPIQYHGVISVMDLSGHVVRTLRVDGHVTGMSLNLACVKRTGDGSCRLVNPATGAVVRRVPGEDPAYGYSDRLSPFGQVAGGTREYKVLRKVSYSLHGRPRLLYEICTFVAAGGRSSGVSDGHAQWRTVQDPPRCVDVDWCAKASVVIDGVVYFLSKNKKSSADVVADGDGSEEQDWIVPFDLETERWRAKIKGPQNLTTVDENDSEMVDKVLSLVNLNGSLVTVHHPYPCMDLWYLLDSDKGLWVRQYSIEIKDYYDPLGICLLSLTPLIVLDDGRIVMHIDGNPIEDEEWGVLKIYDPRTNKFSTVAGLRNNVDDEVSVVSVYTGTLLSLEW